MDPRVVERGHDARRGRFGWLVLGLGMWLGIVVTTGATRWTGPDPHLIRARRMLADYEMGKDRDKLNYGAPLYDEVYYELSRVHPGSESASAARLLRTRLARSIRDFHKRQQDRRIQVEQLRSEDQERHVALEAALRAVTGVERGAGRRSFAPGPEPAL